VRADHVRSNPLEGVLSVDKTVRMAGRRGAHGLAHLL